MDNLRDRGITVLAVDDEEFNLDLIELAFAEHRHVEVHRAVNGAEAMALLPDVRPDVVLLDLAMPVMNGFDVLAAVRDDPAWRHLSVIVVTANAEEKNRALAAGANDFVGKPVDVDELVLRTLNYARIAAYEEYLTDINVILESKISEATGELSEALALATAAETEIAYRMGRTAEFRDLETGFHIRRMSRYSAVLAELHGLPRVECDLILNAAPLHDIGKVGIPDKILLKPGRLTAAEYETMKLHATIGEEMLDDCEGFPLLEAGRIIAAQHHEKYDGGGYPRGLAGDDIHIYGRIVAVADVFDALSSRRVYKDAMPIERVAKLMKDEKGKHFDPVLVDLLLDNLDRFLAIRAEYPDDEDKTPSILELIGEKI